MTTLLTADESTAVTARVAALEKTLGIEIVTIVTTKSDAYPEIVWKAFALGASIAALAVGLSDLLWSEWTTAMLAVSFVVAVLGTGALCALATMYVPGFARCFLAGAQAQIEVMQYAHDQFLSRELFATPARSALLVVVSLLERQVVVLPDKGLRAVASATQWDGVVARMTCELAAGATGAALLAGLDAVNDLVAGKPLASAAANRFDDAPIVDRGR